MKNTILSLALLLLLLSSCKSTAPVVPTDQAQFIFRGTVQQVEAANLPEIVNTKNTAIVKVDEVVYAPPGFTDWTGKSITVAVKNQNAIKPEQRKLFFTNGWLYGKSLAVVEVGDGRDKELTNEQVLASIESQQDDKVRERLKKAELVISGKIVEIKKLEISGNKESEHDPEWALATISIDKALKGSVSSETLEFVFPTSNDVMYAESPSFKEGQAGIWILNRSRDGINYYTVTRPEDFYPDDRIKYITNLLK